jgi:dolichyl-phosphate beta-glucosyltransferase
MPISSLRGPEEAREGGGEGSKRQKRLGATLQTVSAYMVRQPYPSEIIVVDDGTQDGDAECGGPVLRRDPPVRVLQNGRNRGKGFSVRQASYMPGERICCLAMLTSPRPSRKSRTSWPRCTCPLISPSDIAIGSRPLPDSRIEVHRPGTERTWDAASMSWSRRW